jgi:hypothetical protein
MISKSWSRKSIAACLAVAVLSVYSMVVLASPGAAMPSGELSIIGQVSVNGEKVISGGTLFSDSVVATAEKSSAIISISKLGRVELAPNSSLKLSFTDKSVMGLLETGTAHVSTLAGITVNVTTKDASVIVDGSQPTSFTVSSSLTTLLTTHSGIAKLQSFGGSVRQVAAGENASAGNPNPQPKDDEEGLHGAQLAVLLLAIGGAVAGVLYAAFHNNDLNFGGSVTVVSPTK